MATKLRPYYGVPVPSKASKMECSQCRRMCTESAMNNGGIVNGQWVCVRCRRAAQRKEANTMITIEDSQGTIVRRSRNLHGIITHLGQHGASEVHIWRELNGNGRYQFHFGNGDTVRGEFQSFAVLCGWVMSRRNMQGAGLYINGQRSGHVNPRHTFLSKHAA